MENLEDVSVKKVIWQGIGWFLILLIVWLIVGSAIWGWGVATAGIFGRGEMHKEIQSVEYRRGSYEYFYDQQASINALEKQIDTTIRQLERMEKDTKGYDIFLVNLSSLQSMRHRAIQEYNAAAQKQFTSGQFRAEDLPYQILDNEYPPEGVIPWKTRKWFWR